MKKQRLREAMRPAQDYTAGWQWASTKILISLIHKTRVPVFYYASLPLFWVSVPGLISCTQKEGSDTWGRKQRPKYPLPSI